MSERASLDAIVIGSGPNGLAAAIALAQAGRSVRVYEAEPTLGGGMRSAELTEPGFIHDVCSTVHALALASPFLKTLPLADYGLRFAHPLDDGGAAVAERTQCVQKGHLKRRPQLPDSSMRRCHGTMRRSKPNP